MTASRCLSTVIFLLGIHVLSGCGTTTGNALNSAGTPVTVVSGIGSQADLFALTWIHLPGSSTNDTSTTTPTLTLCPSDLRFHSSRLPASGIADILLPSQVVSVGSSGTTLGTSSLAPLIYQQVDLALQSQCGSAPTLDFVDSQNHKTFSSKKSIVLHFTGSYDLSSGGQTVVFLDLQSVISALEMAPQGEDPGDVAEGVTGAGKSHPKKQ